MFANLRRHLAVVVALQGSLLFFISTVTLASILYMNERYGELTWRSDAIVEALNFSVQTVTTVGYGNWSNGLSEDAILRVKMISIPTMFFGAIAFGLLVSGLTNFYAPRPPLHCPQCGYEFRSG